MKARGYATTTNVGGFGGRGSELWDLYLDQGMTGDSKSLKIKIKQSGNNTTLE